MSFAANNEKRNIVVVGTSIDSLGPVPFLNDEHLEHVAYGTSAKFFKPIFWNVLNDPHLELSMDTPLEQFQMSSQ